jgi:hypothetical protein
MSYELMLRRDKEKCHAEPLAKHPAIQGKGLSILHTACPFWQLLRYRSAWTLFLVSA